VRVPVGAAAIGKSREEHVGRHADQRPAGKCRIGGKILEIAQRRRAFERKLDWPLAGQFLPDRKLHVEIHA
jgi:hypothetical protein